MFKAGQAEGYSRDVLKRSKGREVRSAKVAEGWVWQLIPSLDEVKGAPSEQGSKEQNPAPLLPSVLPSIDDRLCDVCGQPVESGKVRRGPCLWRQQQRERIEAAS